MGDGSHSTNLTSTNKADPVLEELGNILFDCLRLDRTSPKTTEQILGAIRARIQQTGAPALLAVRTDQSLQPWQEVLATGLLLSPGAENVSIATVAATCGLSSAHFSRAFKNRFGETPQQWRLGARIERAKSMMVHTPFSLTDIAAECGFAEQSHFNHTFVKRVGSSPGTWRKQQTQRSPPNDVMDRTPYDTV